MAEPDNHQDAENKVQKPKSTLENLIDELGSFAKKTAAIALLTAMPFGYNYIDPTHFARAAVTTGAFAASKVTANIVQEKDAFDGAVRSGFNGTLLSYPIAEGFKGLNSLEAAIQPKYGTVAAKTAKGAAMAFGLQPAIATGNVALNYGLGKKFRENLWPTIKRTFTLIAIPGIINVNWLYQLGLLVQMGVSGSLSFLLNYSKENSEGKGKIGNLYKELNPFGYVGGAATGTAKLVKNVFYAGGGILDGIADYTTNLYKSSPKPAPSPQPAPAVGGGHP